jgi:transposase
MSSIDKDSVREQFNSIKSTFDELQKENKVSPEIRAMMSSLFFLFELIMSIFLEKKTKKNNQNSSIPSSQTDKDESTPPETQGKHSKGNKTDGRSVNNLKVKKTVTLIEVNECSDCGEDLTNTPCSEHERRTKIDIVFEKVIEHFDTEIKSCPTCDTKVQAPFPNDIKSPLQYGIGLKAFILNLVISQMLPLKRTQSLIQSMMNVLISEATILNAILRLHFALAKWEENAIELLLKQPAINADETSLRVNKKNYWIHIYSSGDITLKKLHQKRGKEAINDINIIPKYGGVVIHDCWASYLSYDNCGHGLCGSHLLRELTFVIDSNKYAWAKNMKKLLQKTCKVVSKRKRKKLTKNEYAALQKNYRNILTRGKNELPPLLAKPKGKRGKIAKSDAHNLWERFEKYETAVLLFAKISEVSFTNNRAERDLRMAKVKQKVSGCFRTEIYAHAYCRISSYLQTMKYKGVDPLIAIQMALAGDI